MGREQADDIVFNVAVVVYHHYRLALAVVLCRHHLHAAAHRYVCRNAVACLQGCCIRLLHYGFSGLRQRQTHRKRCPAVGVGLCRNLSVMKVDKGLYYGKPDARASAVFG